MPHVTWSWGVWEADYGQYITWVGLQPTMVTWCMGYFCKYNLLVLSTSCIHIGATQVQWGSRTSMGVKWSSIRLMLSGVEVSVYGGRSEHICICTKFIRCHLCLTKYFSTRNWCMISQVTCHCDRYRVQALLNWLVWVGPAHGKFSLHTWRKKWRMTRQKNHKRRKRRD